MAGEKFNSKSFNPQAFGAYIERIPQLKTNALIKCRAIRGNSTIKALLGAQTGSEYAVMPMYGLLDGDAVNYDGNTDIEATTTKTFERGVVVYGRAKAWYEYDFSEDITNGAGFMGNVAAQISEWTDELNQTTLIAVINGIFGMTDTKGAEFAEAHTYDISGEAADNVCGASTLNSAIQKACGANKNKFTCVLMHSAVATNLENLKLLTYMLYNDGNGIQRDLGLATWNGRTVIIDDELPTSEDASGNTVYTSYVLGDGAFEFVDVGVKVPYEMWRDPKTKGGQDYLYIRQRKCIAPYGISYTKANQASLSPTIDELADGSNWELVHSGESAEADRSYINHKAIPICRIISLG